MGESIYNLILFVNMLAGYFLSNKMLNYFVFNNKEVEDAEELNQKYARKIKIILLYVYAFALVTLILSNISLQLKVIYSVFVSMLIVVATTDFFTYYIYDMVLIIFSVIHVILMIALGLFDLRGSLYGALSGAIIYGIIYVVAKVIYKKEAFGLGDVTLISSIGLVQGFELTILTCFLAFYVAAIFLIFGKIYNQNKDMDIKREIPFGPYICIAAWLSALYGELLIKWYFGMFG